MKKDWQGFGLAVFWQCHV